MADAGTSAVHHGSGPDDGVGADRDAVEHLRTSAKPGPGTHCYAGGAAPLLEDRPAGVLPVVVAAET